MHGLWSQPQLLSQERPSSEDGLGHNPPCVTAVDELYWGILFDVSIHS